MKIRPVHPVAKDAYVERVVDVGDDNVTTLARQIRGPGDRVANALDKNRVTKPCFAYI